MDFRDLKRSPYGDPQPSISALTAATFQESRLPTQSPPAQVALGEQQPRHHYFLGAALPDRLPFPGLCPRIPMNRIFSIIIHVIYTLRYQIGLRGLSCGRGLVTGPHSFIPPSDLPAVTRKRKWLPFGYHSMPVILLGLPKSRLEIRLWIEVVHLGAGPRKYQEERKEERKMGGGQ